MHTTRAEFLQELKAQAHALRQEIEAHAKGIDATPAAIDNRRCRVLRIHDFTFFAYHYFPHYIRGSPSEFQGHFCYRFPKLLNHQSGCNEWWIAPRGEGKTSLLTKIGALWLVVQGLLQQPKVRSAVGITHIPAFYDYVLLFGAETKMPAENIEAIKTELLYNPSLRLDFPDATGKGAVWKVGEFVTKTGVKFESFGAEQAIRGATFGASRPQIVFVDDIITDNEAKSPTERDNRWNWLTRAITHLGPPDGTLKFLAAATVLNHDDPVSRAKNTIGHIVHHFRAITRLPDRLDLWETCEELMRNRDPTAQQEFVANGQPITDTLLPSYQFFIAHQTEMVAGAKISWPSVRTLYQLMRQRAANRRAFDSEMQGEGKNDCDKVFPKLSFWSHRSPYWEFYGACDPSMGKGQTAHPSALLIGGWDRGLKKLYVMEADLKRRVPSKLESDIIALQRKYRCHAWAFENNNAYEYMRRSFIQNAAGQGINLPLHGVTATQSPNVLIDSLEPHICGLDPSILFHPKLSQLLDQLGTWPEPQSHHHYDGLIGLYLLWMTVITRGRGHVVGQFRIIRRPDTVDFSNY